MRLQQQEMLRRMSRYAVIRGRETPGRKRRDAIRVQPNNGGAGKGVASSSNQAAPITVDKTRAAKNAGQLRRRGLRNKYVLGVVMTGKLLIGNTAFDGITKRRIDEMAYISGELPKFYQGRRYGPLFRRIGAMLDACSPRRPSGSMLSFLCRHKREREEYRRVQAAFASVPTNEIFLETKLVGLISGTVASLPKTAEKVIADDRRRNRNHIQHFIKSVPQYQNLMAFKVYEFDCYRADDLRRVYERYSNGDLPADERTAEGEDWDDYLAWSRGRNPPRISRRKIKTLLEMGWNPADDQDVWLVHSHALIRVQNPEEYYRLQKENLYPHDYQVVLTGLRKNKSRDDNIRDIIRYLLKVTPRYGALFSDQKRQDYLAGVALKRFIALYDALGYQGVKAHFALSPKATCLKK
ncbi:MAG TPA: hypothetical protein VF268_00770 [Gammaproteobacteria bacterium]